MSNWVEESVKGYYDWLRNRTNIIKDESTGWFLISTPFVGMFNDTINLYAKEVGNEKILLSDDGETLGNLSSIGVNISKSSKRKELVEHIKSNFGISVNDLDEITIETTPSKLIRDKHNIISAIMEISDMYLLSNQTVTSVFKDDVGKLLDEKKVLYTPQFIVKGTSGIEFTFDYMIASYKKEVVIKSFNTLNQNNLPAFLFGWDDIKIPRENVSHKELSGLVFINDETSKVKDEYLDAIKYKGADYILWSERFKRENLIKIGA